MNRLPQQARSVARMNRILDVASELLAEEGWDAFTIAEISRRANVSVGVIYQRFGDKDGLFATIHDAHLARFAARARREFEPGRGRPTWSLALSSMGWWSALG